MNYAAWKSKISYDPTSQILTVRNPIYHVVHISSRGYHSERFGYEEIALELGHEGERAILRGHNGKATIKIVPSKIEYDRVLVGMRKNSLTLRIGELGGDKLDGKAALIAHLEKHPDGKDEKYGGDDICLSRLGSVLISRAEERGIAAGQPEMNVEAESLKRRAGFEYDKDFSYLYKIEDILPVD